MNILFLTPQLPYPPQQGTALRNWGLITGLARRHRVSLLSFLGPEQDGYIAAPLRDTCAAVEAVPQPIRTMTRRLRSLLTSSLPDMALRLESTSFRLLLDDWLARERFDVVHVEGIELAPYLDLLLAARPRPFVLFDDHNCEYLLQKRVCLTDLPNPLRWHGAAYSFIQWRRLLRYESATCRRADHVLAVSEADAVALRTQCGVIATVLPNGIDMATYKPGLAAAEGMGAAALVFTGTMDYRPNVDAVLWFARHVLPRIRSQVPEAHLWVVGQRPHRRLESLRREAGITLTGRVESTLPYIAGAAVYVAPLRMGGGTRLKLLEAMALERAVVATRLGAEGFPLRGGRELLLADEPERFAQAVVSLLRDPARRRALGQAGRRFVQARYDWSALIPRLEEVYPSGE